MNKKKLTSPQTMASAFLMTCLLFLASQTHASSPIPKEEAFGEYVVHYSALYRGVAS